MQNVRNIMNSNAWQSTLEQFNDLINRPNSTVQNINERNHDQSDTYMNRFENYTNEVNRQVSNIGEILN